MELEKLLCNHEWRYIQNVMGDRWTGRKVGRYIVEPDQVLAQYPSDYLIEPEDDRWITNFSADTKLDNSKKS